MTKGHCMRGAVTVTVAQFGDNMNACHCDMCRRWTGSAFVAVRASAKDVDLQGPVKTIARSDWATRGWCDTCGSTLFYRTNADGSYGLSAGLFANTAGRQLNIEYFVDQKPDGFAYAGDHKRLTEAETLAFFGVT
jgi:hypothetical protein